MGPDGRGVVGADAGVDEGAGVVAVGVDDVVGCTDGAGRVGEAVSGEVAGVCLQPDSASSVPRSAQKMVRHGRAEKFLENRFT